MVAATLISTAQLQKRYFVNMSKIVTMMTMIIMMILMTMIMMTTIMIMIMVAATLMSTAQL